ncbi:hypothetical protein F0562_005919 [Nyssa sinensis]|uniref:Uncharacterized protein n=1 Tax=Nyssa sinensis TaxID=561372 RepID=A0A5J5AP48_9ASTE|nr:hypothetical protein F0562_005919 [Nyssa sinensis]
MGHSSELLALFIVTVTVMFIHVAFGPIMFVYGLVTITDQKMINDLQSELDETRLRLVAVQSFAFATMARSNGVVALVHLSIRTGVSCSEVGSPRLGRGLKR